MDFRSPPSFLLLTLEVRVCIGDILVAKCLVCFFSLVVWGFLFVLFVCLLCVYFCCGWRGFVCLV